MKAAERSEGVYLHIGWGELMDPGKIVSICSYDSWEHSPDNRRVDGMLQVEGKTETVCATGGDGRDEFRSVIVCRDSIVFSPITAGTLRQRLEKSVFSPSGDWSR